MKFIKSSAIFISIFLLCGCNIYNNQENISKAYSYFYKGLVNEYNQEWDKASENFYKAYLNDSKSCRIYIHLAKSLIFLQLNKEAQLCIEEAEELAKEKKYEKDYLLYYDIGEIYELLGNYEKALIYYEKCLKIYPNFEKAYEREYSILDKYNLRYYNNETNND